MEKTATPSPDGQMTDEMATWRKSNQILAPVSHQPVPDGQYDVFPAFPIGAGKIQAGYDALTEQLLGHSIVTIDGYGGVLWDHFRVQLEAALARHRVRTHWISIDAALKPENEIEDLVRPYLGGDDPIFGTRFTGTLADFIDYAALKSLRP